MNGKIKWRIQSQSFLLEEIEIAGPEYKTKFCMVLLNYIGIMLDPSYILTITTQAIPPKTNSAVAKRIATFT